MNLLSKLAIVYCTDKFFMHNYTEKYFDILKDLQDQSFNMMEIGVGGYKSKLQGGQSLAVWRDFFPKAQITGVDIFEKSMDLGERVQIHQGSQVDPDFLNEVRQKRGPFLVMLDDGSHLNEHVIETFGYLYSELADGGFYIVEDVQTAFFPSFKGTINPDDPNASNSVYFFADVQQNIEERKDIFNIRRFHNIVSLEKSTVNQGQGFDAQLEHLLTRLDGRAATVLDCDSSTGAPDDLIEKITSIVPNVKIISLEGDLAKSIKKHDPDIVLSYDKNTQADFMIDTCLGNLTDHKMWVHCDRESDVSDSFQSDFRKLFIDVEHSEIHVNFPDFEVHKFADRAYEVSRYHNIYAVCAGPNDYPSNFDFDYDHPEAAANLVKVYDLLPEVKDSQAVHGLFSIFHKAGKEDWALEALSYTKPDDMVVANHFTEMFRRSDILKQKDMLKVAKRASETYPDKPAIILAGAHYLVAQKKFTEAIEMLNNLLDDVPNTPPAINLLATILYNNGETDKAIEIAAKEHNRNPANLRATLIYARGLLAQKKIPEAIEVLEMRSDRHAENPIFVKTLETARLNAG